MEGLGGSGGCHDGGPEGEFGGVCVMGALGGQWGDGVL